MNEKLIQARLSSLPHRRSSAPWKESIISISAGQTSKGKTPEHVCGKKFQGIKTNFIEFSVGLNRYAWPQLSESL